MEFLSVNDLRHVPLKDLAALGGWKDTQTLLNCYLTKDEAAMVEALRSRTRGTGSKGEEGGADASDDISDIASDGERPEAAAGSEPEARHYIPIRDNRTRSR